MNNECKKNIETMETELAECYNSQNSKEDFKKHIDTIRAVHHQAEKDAASGIITREFCQSYIDKIFVSPENGVLKLEIMIFTGETDINRALPQFRKLLLIETSPFNLIAFFTGLLDKYR